VGIPGIPLGMAIVGVYFLLFPMIGLLFRSERKMFRIVYAVVGIGLILWIAMLIIAYVAPTQSHFGSH
jgi:uncharacterized membrane protein YuzA (DUF378 family)